MRLLVPAAILGCVLAAVAWAAAGRTRPPTTRDSLYAFRFECDGCSRASGPARSDRGVRPRVDTIDTFTIPLDGGASGTTSHELDRRAWLLTAAAGAFRLSTARAADGASC